ncbi:exopolysaccharide Pel transporter PelG [Salipiger sp. P9]|uniref:exopolysaccharide Pel transporter PelG n=1 Tax=Salipiger pentaromativorans TaxID=2943193 RepID=UPI0021577AE3|nr:exopolysaccharide Pel transporter PelG [Salipiger pentaromativorans]MCR8548672.1 exopolysaccharide Pel transporter PelG [Salipiger pentaromativorans]
MAGIGIRLDHMVHSGGLGLAALALGQALLLAAGQWMLAVLGLAAAGALVALIAGPETVIAFRLVVTIAVLSAMLATAAPLLVAGRALSDALYAQRPERIPALISGMAALSVLLAAALCPAFLSLLGLDRASGVMPASVALAALFALLWGLAGQATALRRFGAVAVALLAGTVLSVAAVAGALVAGGGLAAMAWGYGAGVALSAGALARALFRTFPFDAGPLWPAMRDHLVALRRHGALAGGSLLGALGLWIDKLILWNLPGGQVSAIGLRYREAYDGAVFFGLLALVPGLALLLIAFEGRLFLRLRAWMGELLGHATLEEIRAESADLAQETVGDLRRVLLVQAVVAFGVCVAAPRMAAAGWIGALQAPVLAFTAVGCVFYLAALGAALVLINLDLARRYLAVQAVFCGATALATGLTLLIGPQALGLGFPLGALAAGGVGFVLMREALDALPRHVFRRAAAPG